MRDSYDDVRSLPLDAVRRGEYDQAKVLASLLLADALTVVSETLASVPTSISVEWGDVPTLRLVPGDDLPTRIWLDQLY